MRRATARRLRELELSNEALASARARFFRRDPSGFMFIADGELLRQVHPQYREHFDHLIDSGLYQELVDAHAIDPARRGLRRTSSGNRRLQGDTPRADRLHRKKTPTNGAFSELKDAALTTLAVQKLALARGMVLKDASSSTTFSSTMLAAPFFFEQNRLMVNFFMTLAP